MPVIKRNLDIHNIDVIPAPEANPESLGYSAQIVESAEPGKPGIVFYNTAE
jgi:leucyl-tRNA synthetase